MTGDRSRRDASSTSLPRRSRRSRRSDAASSASRSSGEPAAAAPDGLGASVVRDLARRHGVRPTKALGQNFLIDPNLARAIASDSGIGPADRVVEVGAGFGSLTVALAATGAHVVAIEFDRALVAALRENVGALPSVRIVHDDAMHVEWGAILGRETGAASQDRPWVLCANLPYNIATPLVLDVLRHVPQIGRAVVTVQREVGERLAASAGEAAYGAVSVRVAARADASIVRRVPASVFWPRPTVESVVVRLERLAEPPVDPDDPVLHRVVDAAFAERRKTMRNALRRLGLSSTEADQVLESRGLAPNVRPEELGVETFAAIAEAVRSRLPAA